MEITKGKWEVHGKLCVLAQNVNATETICQLFDDNDETLNNAILIADAGNTYQATNKLPSELAESNRILAEALTAFIDGKERDYNKLFDNAVKVLANHA